MPHITEKIWQILPLKYYKDNQKFLMKCDYPTELNIDYSDAVNKMDKTIEAIKGLRNLRQSLNVVANVKINVSIFGDKNLFEQTKDFLIRMVRIENIEITDKKLDKVPEKSASCVVGDTTFIVPLKGIIDIDTEIARQNKKIEKLNKEKMSLEGRINNANFVKNAPKEVIDSTKTRIDELSQEIKAIEKIIANLE